MPVFGAMPTTAGLHTEKCNSLKRRTLLNLSIWLFSFPTESCTVSLEIMCACCRGNQLNSLTVGTA